jgi:hypothetical protein
MDGELPCVGGGPTIWAHPEAGKRRAASATGVTSFERPDHDEVPSAGEGQLDDADEHQPAGHHEVAAQDDHPDPG